MTDETVLAEELPDALPDGPGRSPIPTRRQVLGGAVGGLATAALAGARGMPALAAGSASHLPHPGKSGIDKIVVLMMENRSFDHFLGWLPGAAGKQAGLHFHDKSGKRHPTWHLPFFQSCGYFDPDHSYQGGRIQYADGKLNGWLMTAEADRLPIGYYEKEDLAFYGHAAPYWTTCDRYFAATLGPTYPNRFYQHSAQTDRADDSTTTSTLPTIWDRLADAGVTHRYYFSDIPFLALYGSKYAGISQPVSSFMAAAAAGTLPAVSYVDPRFLGEGQGSSGDDHPLADIRVGQSFVSSIYNAVVSGPDWHRTLLVINYDEWGGFFDHVKPTRAPDTHPRFGLRGFRVPAMVISPRARRHHVAHHTYDHTSVLKLIEWRHGLRHLTPRDRHARNIAEVLDFSRKPNLHAPTWNVSTPSGAGAPCQSSTSTTSKANHEYEWGRVLEKARDHGFDV